MASLRCAAIAKTSYNADIYEPSDDSFALVDALRENHRVWTLRKPSICVEIGCGSGYVICSAALMLQDLNINCACHATDISEHALKAAHETLQNHGVHDAVDLVQTDLMSAFHERWRHQVDILLFNPPYVVSPDEELLQEGIARSWAGGMNGRVVIDRLLNVLDHYLSPQGRLYMITVQDNDPLSIIAAMSEKHNFQGDIVLSRRADEELIHVVTLARRE